MENLKYIHKNIHNAIDKSDNKASISFGIKLIVLGYFLTFFQSLNLKDPLQVLMILMFISSSAASYLFLIMIIYPRLSLREQPSMIYFKHIARRYAKNRKKAIQDYMLMTDNALEKDLINQIVTLSVLADYKYRHLQKGIILMFMEVAFLSILNIIK